MPKCPYYRAFFFTLSFRKEETILQEEIENRSVTLAISATKLSARVLRSAIAKLLAEWQKSRDAPAKLPHGKQTVKELVGQNQGVSNIEVTDGNIKSFERVARKYGVDYAVKKDSSVSPPKWLVFFKARDAGALTAAFTEFATKTVKREQRPSVLQTPVKFKEMLTDTVIAKTRKKELER